MRKPCPQVRETILKALHYLGEAEPSDDSAEEAQDDHNLAKSLAWIQGYVQPLWLE